MATRTAADVRKQIASGDADPIYLLQGEDDVEKAALASEFLKLVDEGLAAFNVDRVHAGGWTSGDALREGISSLVAAVRTLPMMSPRRVVIVSQADLMLQPKRESDAAKQALEEFQALVERPEPMTTLVLVAGSLDKRTKVYKALAKSATTLSPAVLKIRPRCDAISRSMMVRHALSRASVPTTGQRATSCLATKDTGSTLPSRALRQVRRVSFMRPIIRSSDQGRRKRSGFETNRNKAIPRRQDVAAHLRQHDILVQPLL